MEVVSHVVINLSIFVLAIYVGYHVVWTVTPETLYSKGKNTPLLGQQMRGKAVLTMYKGTITHQQ